MDLLVKKTSVSIPQGVKKIYKQAFLNCNVRSIYLPASIDSIGYQAFLNEKRVTLLVSKKNSHYARKEDCLYSKKSGRLVAAINRNGKLVISDKVKKLSKGTSVLGGKFREITIPKSVKVMQKYWDYDFYIDYKDNKHGHLTFLGMTAPKMDGFLASTIYVPAKAYDAYYKEVHKGPLKSHTRIVKVK